MNIYSVTILIRYVLNVTQGLYDIKKCMRSIWLGLSLQIFALTELGNSTLKSLEKIYDFINVYLK